MLIEKTILIIDNDIDFQFMIGSMLQTSGFKVRMWLDAKTETVGGTVGNCDIILLNTSLAGDSAVENIGKELKALPETLHIPVILLREDSEDPKLPKEFTGDALFQKPFAFSELLIKIKELLYMTEGVHTID